MDVIYTLGKIIINAILEMYKKFASILHYFFYYTFGSSKGTLIFETNIADALGDRESYSDQTPF